MRPDEYQIGNGLRAPSTPSPSAAIQVKSTAAPPWRTRNRTRSRLIFHLPNRLLRRIPLVQRHRPQRHFGRHLAPPATIRPSTFALSVHPYRHARFSRGFGGLSGGVVKAVIRNRRPSGCPALRSELSVLGFGSGSRRARASTAIHRLALAVSPLRSPCGAAGSEKLLRQHDSYARRKPH